MISYIYKILPGKMLLTVDQIPSESYCDPHHPSPSPPPPDHPPHHHCYSHFLAYYLYICCHCLQYNELFKAQDSNREQSDLKCNSWRVELIVTCDLHVRRFECWLRSFCCVIISNKMLNFSQNLTCSNL